MTTTKIDVPTPDQKEEHRKELARQIDEYLANGGTITKCPPNAFTETDIEGKPKRKHGGKFLIRLFDWPNQKNDRGVRDA